MKAIMMLDKEHLNNGIEGEINLYEPYTKVLTGLQAMRAKKKLAKNRQDHSVQIKRTEPLAKLILNDFENRDWS